MSAPVAAPPRHSGGRRASKHQRAAAERTRRTLGRRRLANRVMVGVMYLAAGLATLPLVLILFHLLREGSASISLDLFTKMKA